MKISCNKEESQLYWPCHDIYDYTEILHDAILNNKITPTQYFKLHETDSSYLDTIYEMSTYEIKLPSPDSSSYMEVMQANNESREERERIEAFICEYKSLVNPSKNRMDDPVFRKKIQNMREDEYYDAILNDCNRIIAAYEKYPDSNHLSNTKYIKNGLMDSYERSECGLRTPREALRLILSTNFSPRGGRCDPLIDGPEDVCVFHETAKVLGVKL